MCGANPEADPEHYEFLATDASDHRREFIASLCAALGDSGNIVVYNATFESQRLSELAAAAGVLWADQENTAPSLGFATRHLEPRLPSSICRIVLPQNGVASACS